MTIWLACSDCGVGLTGINTSPSGTQVDDSVLGLGVREQLFAMCIDLEYSHDPPESVIALLAEKGWQRDPEQDRDNGYVSGTAFTRS